jgi:uncharacterized membrane protein
MESRVKLFGHPVHPMLIVVPLGLFISAVILDVIQSRSSRCRRGRGANLNAPNSLSGRPAGSGTRV